MSIIVGAIEPDVLCTQGATKRDGPYDFAMSKNLDGSKVVGARAVPDAYSKANSSPAVSPAALTVCLWGAPMSVHDPTPWNNNLRCNRYFFASWFNAGELC